MNQDLNNMNQNNVNKENDSINNKLHSNSNKFKKIIIISIIGLALAIVLICLLINKNSTNNLKELPKPEITEGQRGELGIDKNINESTIDEYLNRKDSIYRDMRMLEDPGNYENIGGDRYLSGYIQGFEVIPLPYIIPVDGLPNEVGNTYTGTTLFHEENGVYVANYNESMEIIEQIFPKDKNIFLMCGGGGYAGMTKKFLVSLGWNENKIYNVGGFWYYKGKYGINIKKEVNGEISYDFDKVPYHNIEFSKLTKSNNYVEPKVKVEKLKINTSELELEEGNSFKLDVIVLPNEAENKELKWKSSDDSVAIVTDDGLVKAIKSGSAEIIAESVEGKKTVSCKITVNKKNMANIIKMSNISTEAKQFNEINLEKISKEFYSVFHNPDGSTKEEYRAYTGDGYTVNDLGKEEYDKYKNKFQQALNDRLNIFNKLIDEKKSFIILIYSKQCNVRPYSIVNGAEKILGQNNFSYLKIGTLPLNGDTILENSKIDGSKLLNGGVAIIKDGKVYSSINPDVDSIKSDGELKNWLSKYINIE